jgi:ABC-type oligopeptide transport system substrate-binding subunit
VIDAPGPWGTGPFILTEGYSSLCHEQAVISSEPFACTWLWRGDRTPQVRLVANERYWNRARGPHVEEVVFRNDLSRERALELVCTTDGEVDILTEVGPEDAAQVERSAHARLVASDGMKVVAGIIDRDSEDLPLADRRARQALNLAVDREAMFGRARALGGLTPPTALTALHRLRSRLRPYPHDPRRAAQLWRAAAGASSRTLRIAAPVSLDRVARLVASDLRAALDVDADVRVLQADDVRETRRALAERSRPRDWDLLLWQHVPQTADAPPHELHRAFAGADGEYRAGPELPRFDELFRDLRMHTSPTALVRASNRIDEFVRSEALALFLVAPHALYALNREVRFRPYRTSFELAECRVSERHHSRR